MSLPTSERPDPDETDDSPARTAENDAPSADSPDASPATPVPASRPREIGGQAGPEPTRYGDWERKGRCTDF